MNFRRLDTSSSYCSIQDIWVTLCSSEVLQHRDGIYPSPFDYQPLIEEEEPGLFMAAGFSGTNLMHASANDLTIRNLIKFGKSEKN